MQLVGHIATLNENSKKKKKKSPDNKTKMMEKKTILLLLHSLFLKPSDSMPGCTAQQWSRVPLVGKDAGLCSVVCTSRAMLLTFPWAYPSTYLIPSPERRGGSDYWSFYFKHCDGLFAEDHDILLRPGGTLGFWVFLEAFWLHFQNAIFLVETKPSFCEPQGMTES